MNQTGYVFPIFSKLKLRLLGTWSAFWWCRLIVSQIEQNRVVIIIRRSQKSIMTCANPSISKQCDPSSLRNPITHKLLMPTTPPEAATPPPRLIVNDDRVPLLSSDLLPFLYRRTVRIAVVTNICLLASNNTHKNRTNEYPDHQQCRIHQEW